MAVNIEHRKTAELMLALHRDVRWLETQLKRIVRAEACDGDKLRAIAAEVLETAKKRSERTLSR